MSPLKVLIVEDEALVAAMIKEALDGSKYAVRATAYNKQTALSYLANTPFDVAILDINLQGEFDGIDVGREIRDNHAFPFLYLTAHADDRTLQNAKLTQPSGFIVKPFTERELLAGLEVALYNHRLQIQSSFGFPDLKLIDKHLDEPLSGREHDVLRLLFEGKTNIEMAEELYLSVNTIKTHLARLYSKFDVSSRTAVIARIRDVIR